MNARRAFLRLTPLAGFALACPVVATAAAVLASREQIPMSGQIDGQQWVAMLISTTTPSEAIPYKSFVSHSMERRPDGRYELIFDREA